jgi:hypothetical protein
MASRAPQQPEKPLYIKLHEDDNVAIIVNSDGLPAGSVFDDGLTLREHVPQGHKVALTDIAKDGLIKRYGEVNGYAESDIARGSLLWAGLAGSVLIMSKRFVVFLESIVCSRSG